MTEQVEYVEKLYFRSSLNYEVLEAECGVPTDDPRGRAFYFRTTSDAYDGSQLCDEIKDGDLLVVNGGETIGVLDRAWPVCLYGPARAFHLRTPEGYGDVHPEQD